ncbi:hypothetical protein B0H15DRAFT_1020985 [Mycena belliarum]|uniref:Uncharacterized protein n=1 Tax=Mycena belliarum TaxID=1033014 RepID=A0AAD6U6R1_9AGAR|nr:hypothetical protein B0H15DRAFT_1020985 [Mycena belliae]
MIQRALASFFSPVLSNSNSSSSKPPPRPIPLPIPLPLPSPMNGSFDSGLKIHPPHRIAAQLGPSTRTITVVSSRLVNSDVDRTQPSLPETQEQALGP